MHRKSIYTLVLLGLFFLPQIAWGQLTYSNDDRLTEAEAAPQSGFDTFTLGDMVVSADPDERYQVSMMSVMTEEDIRATNSKTLGDALKYIPGVVSMDSDNFKGHANITVNGLRGRNILVLVDGVPFYETAYRTLDLNQIPAAVISRLEVTKGNASVLYGPNAMGGMVNVITKKGSIDPQVSAYAEVGDYNTYNLGASVGGSYNIVNAWLSVDHRESDGWRMSNDFDPRVGYLHQGNRKYYYGTFENGGKRDNTDLDTTSVWARVGVEPWRNSEYYLSFHYVTKDGGGAPGVDKMNFPYAQNTRDRFTWASRWDKYEEMGFDFTGKQELFEDFTLIAKLFYHQHEDRMASYDFADIFNGVNTGWTGYPIGTPGHVNNPVNYGDLDLWAKKVAVSVYEDTMYGAQVIGDWKINDMHTVRASAQWREDEHKQKGDKSFKSDKAKSETGSVGFEYQLSLFDRHLGIVAGISYDWFEVTSVRAANYSNTDVFLGWKYPEKGGQKDSWNPMIGANFLFPESTGFMAGTEIYGSVAKKTTFPTLREMATARGANPDLDPQESINYIIGVKRDFYENKLTLGASGFYYDITDWITNDQNRWLDANGRSKSVNFGDINIWGFELEAAVRPSENVTFTANYTYNDGENKSSQRGSNRVTGIFKHKVGLGAKWYIPEIGLRLDGRAYYVGTSYDQLPTFTNNKQPTEKTDSFFVAGLTATKYLFEDHLEIYAAVDNIFDADYGKNYPGRGRSFILGSRISF